MIVFKTFLKVLNRYKGMVILYTVILLGFGVFSNQSNGTSMSFVDSKPNILIVNEDKREGITASFISYMKKNSKIVEVKNSETARDDALFYRDVSYIIYVPANYREDFLSGTNPEIKVKSTGDYQASLAELLLKRYVRVSSFYQGVTSSEDEIIRLTEETLANDIEVNLTSKVDTNRLTKVTTYYNFANYCLLAGCIYVICMILSSFKNQGVFKRTVISSMKYSRLNRNLLLSNGLFAFSLWLFYVIISFVIIGDVMFRFHGLFYIINSFLFTFCALTIAFFLSSFLHNKEAISGIVNVIALGSSFLCGAFVPMEWLPSFVLRIAHILPSYWYIKTNELLKNVESFTFSSMKPILFHMGMLFLFSIFFILLANYISNKRRKIC